MSSTQTNTTRRTLGSGEWLCDCSEARSPTCQQCGVCYQYRPDIAPLYDTEMLEVLRASIVFDLGLNAYTIPATALADYPEMAERFDAFFGRVTL